MNDAICVKMYLFWLEQHCMTFTNLQFEVLDSCNACFINKWESTVQQALNSMLKTHDIFLTEKNLPCPLFKKCNDT